MPLMLQAQELQNKLAALNIPEKEAAARFWEDAGGAGKALPSIMQILKFLRGN